jgi:hypothetical protein
MPDRPPFVQAEGRGPAFAFFVCLWAHFLLRKKPGFPLQFLDFTCGKVCGISVSIPCAAQKWHPCHFWALRFCFAKTYAFITADPATRPPA